MLAGAFGVIGYFMRRLVTTQDGHDERIRRIEQHYVPEARIDAKLEQVRMSLSAEIKAGYDVLREENRRDREDNARLREDVQYIRTRLDEKK